MSPLALRRPAAAFVLIAQLPAATTIGVTKSVQRFQPDLGAGFREPLSFDQQAAYHEREASAPGRYLTVEQHARRAERRHQHPRGSGRLAEFFETAHAILTGVDLFQAPADPVAAEAAAGSLPFTKAPEDASWSAVISSAQPQDWLMLLVVSVALLTFDYVVLQRRCEGPPQTIPPTSEKALKEMFLGCAQKLEGSAEPRALLAACAAHEQSEALFDKEHAARGKGARSGEVLAKLRDRSAAVSWDEFRTIYEEYLAHCNTRSGGNVRQNVLVLMFWLVAGACYNAMVWQRHGTAAGVQWCTGYALEWMLSMDNLFIFHLIFEAYATPRSMVHRSLFLGIAGAAFFRMVFFVTLSSLLHLVRWVRFAFGALLIYSGIQIVMDNGEEEDVSDQAVVRLIKYVLGDRLLDRYDLKNHSMFVWHGGRLCATLLVPVVISLEVTDILFAMDSVSAKVAQIPDYYLSYSSSLLAMFGLRAMLFIIQDLVDCFELLKFGLCLILVFIGVELMASDYVHVSPEAVCIMIVTVFVVCILGSAAYRRAHPQQSCEDADEATAAC